MPENSAQNATPFSTNDPGPVPARVYSIELFLQIQRLMEKLNLTPADCLQLLAEVLEDLDRQIDNYEEGDGLPFPPL